MRKQASEVGRGPVVNVPRPAGPALLPGLSFLTSMGCSMREAVESVDTEVNGVNSHVADSSSGDSELGLRPVRPFTSPATLAGSGSLRTGQLGG